MTQITTNELRAKWAGKDRWLSDGGSRGAGHLVARIKRNGVFFYFQYIGPDGRKRLFPLGVFDVHGKRGLSLAAARERSAELSALYRKGTIDIHAHFELQRAQAAREQQAAEKELREEEAAVAEALDRAERRSLTHFLTAYVEYLQRAGKPSAKDVANMFKNHVFSDAALSARDASLVETDDFVGIISKVVESGHGRTAAKLRSYLHAAYALGVKARTKPSAPQAIREFGIKVNPITGIDAMADYNKALDRNLTAVELVAFLKRVHALPIDARRDALEVCIYMGGQRPTQLLRLRRADVDLTSGVATLYDSKGRRKQPRPHVVPLTPQAAAILERRLANLVGSEHVFSTDGRSAMDRGTLTNFVTGIAMEMVNAREAHEAFTLRDIRRTLETLLASWGVSSDTRKHLQSHGLGGVQQRHYDRYEYLREKSAALKLLAKRLDRLLAGGGAPQNADPNRGADSSRKRSSTGIPAVGAAG